MTAFSFPFSRQAVFKFCHELGKRGAEAPADRPQLDQVSDDLFLRLAKSEFSKIGKSKITAIFLDGEKVKLPLVTLSKGVRTNMGRFLVCFITEQVERLIERCGTHPTGREVEPFLRDLESLIQISRAVSNEKAFFLHRR